MGAFDHISDGQNGQAGGGEHDQQQGQSAGPGDQYGPGADCDQCAAAGVDCAANARGGAGQMRPNGHHACRGVRQNHTIAKAHKADTAEEGYRLRVSEEEQADAQDQSQAGQNRADQHHSVDPQRV